ncbi:hypothetical protein AAFF_G00259570 [Aldrovandia affinis]|uniref:Uncharacterized protein n=1 Tax=Aldrovandia affinis TaxID=143900 RepID=A0AAD7RET0_9TELE|nr:hypothetical protein AAFF_G00259570 [Aldrovandia affinis]
MPVSSRYADGRECRYRCAVSRQQAGGTEPPSVTFIALETWINSTARTPLPRQPMACRELHKLIRVSRQREEKRWRGGEQMLIGSIETEA